MQITLNTVYRAVLVVIVTFIVTWLGVFTWAMVDAQRLNKERAGLQPAVLDATKKIDLYEIDNDALAPLGNSRTESSNDGKPNNGNSNNGNSNNSNKGNSNKGHSNKGHSHNANTNKENPNMKNSNQENSNNGNSNKTITISDPHFAQAKAWIAANIMKNPGYHPLDRSNTGSIKPCTYLVLYSYAGGGGSQALLKGLGVPQLNLEKSTEDGDKKILQVLPLDSSCLDAYDQRLMQLKGLMAPMNAGALVEPKK